jgi:RNA polymerase sigma-70 factor (ECF subfamily)
MGADQPAAVEGASVLLALYDRALPQVYGYLVSRCGSPPLAEDLTAETFLAAVTALQRGTAELTTGWLVTVARRKLVDHWRRAAREERKLQLAAGEPEPVEPPWDEQLDATRAGAVLSELGAHHRAALTLRYVDGLRVPEVAEHLGRTVHATEALLVRARSAFRRAYGERRGDGD